MQRILLLTPIVFLLAFAGVRADDPNAQQCNKISAIQEVNANRQARGLRPFIEDKSLTEGALAVATFRAKNLIAGHTRNDFGFLPAGARASVGGCAAWPPSLGWGACATYDNYRYAGAAWVIGRDGKRYMSLFAR